jgi:transposase
MNKTIFVGIDIGSKNFVVTIFKINVTSEFTNDLDGFVKFDKFLQANNVIKEDSILVMETTGVYCEQLCNFLYSNGYDLCVENALKVKRAFDLSPRKNDIVDSNRIAEYAMRFNDQLKLWKPQSQILDEINSLLSLREQFVTQNTANKNILKVFNKKVNQSYFAIETLESVIDKLKQQIKDIEKQIKALLISDYLLCDKYLALISIPGVSLLLASELLVLTDGFNKTLNHKEIAAYLGICPHEYSSGTMVKKPRSAGYGHSRIRKLIYLASLSVRTHHPDFKKYFERKLIEGKNPRMLINNLANKLIKLICGVILSGKKFIPSYKSVSA